MKTRIWCFGATPYWNTRRWTNLVTYGSAGVFSFQTVDLATLSLFLSSYGTAVSDVKCCILSQLLHTENRCKCVNVSEWTVQDRLSCVSWGLSPSEDWGWLVQETKCVCQKGLMWILVLHQDFSGQWENVRVMYSSLIVKRYKISQIDCWFFLFEFSLIFFSQTYPLPHFLPEGLKTGFPEAC